MAIEKNKILGAASELTAKLHCQFSPFCPFYAIIGLDWQWYLASSSKTTPQYFNFFSCHEC